MERELQSAEDVTPEGVNVVATPLYAGPPTIIPGSAASAASTQPPSRRARLLRAARDTWPLLVGAIALVAGAILLAPFLNDLVAQMNVTPAPARAAPARTAHAAAAAAAPSAPMNAALLHGPWRCVDQRTGLSSYWSYAANGALNFHGEVLSDRPVSGAAAWSAPTGWRLEGQRLFHTFEQSASVTYTVSDLTLARLRYGDERGVDIQCRRP